MSELRRGSYDEYDDFDKFISHSDFGKILELAGTLKDQKAKLVTLAKRDQGRGESSPSLTMRKPKKTKAGPNKSHSFDQESAFADRPLSRSGLESKTNSFDHGQFDDAAELIRTTLIPSAKEGSDGVGAMERGQCLITDSLIDETIKSLADELKLCLDLKKQLRMSRQASRISESSSGELEGMNYGNTKQLYWNEPLPPPLAATGGGGGTAAVANKFSKWQTDILTRWMIENREHPFPSTDEIEELAEATNLTKTQVVNWTTNVRKRNLKATVEREKKPHHFLDYLFLATDREKKMRREHSDIDFSFLDELNEASKGAGGLDSLAAVGPSAPFLNHGHDLFDSQTAKKAARKTQAAFHPISSSSYSSFSTRQPYPQPDIHRRPPVAPPRAPRNVDEIFRRGASGYRPKSRSKKAAHERDVLQAYAPEGLDRTPPGSFDRNEVMDVVDEGVFDEYSATTAAKAPPLPNDVKTVSFESMNSMSMGSMNDAPFDESAQDYLMKLLR